MPFVFEENNAAAPSRFVFEDNVGQSMGGAAKAPQPRGSSSSGGVIRSFGSGLTHGTLGLAESVGTGLEYLGAKTGSEGIESVGKDTSRYWGRKAEGFAPPSEIQGSIVDKPGLLKKPEWWAYHVAEVVPSFAASILPGTGAAKMIKAGGTALKFTPAVVARLARIGGAVFGGLSGGALEGTNTYQEVIRRGGTKEEAASAAELMTLASAGLNAISVGKALGPAKGIVGKAKHIGTSSLVESLTEYLEEPSEAVILGDDVVQALKEGLNVIPPTLLTGALGGAGGTMVNRGYDQGNTEALKELTENLPVEEVEAVQAANEPVEAAGERFVIEEAPVTEQAPARFVFEEEAKMETAAEPTQEAATPEAVAGKLDIIYNGVQEMPEGMAPLYLYTDKQTGGTFAVKDTAEQAVKMRLEEKRAEFAAAEPAVAPDAFTLKGQQAQKAKAPELKQETLISVQPRFPEGKIPTKDAGNPMLDEIRAREAEARQMGLPERTTDTMSDAIAMSSPEGKISGRSRKQAEARLKEKLFGKEGLPAPVVKQPTEQERLLRQAAELRDMAERGMKPRAYIKKAEELEARAALAPRKKGKTPDWAKPEYTSTEAHSRLKASIDKMVAEKEKTKSGKGPATLADFVRTQGGLSTTAEQMKGELRDRFSIKEGYNLINNKRGVTIDEMGEKAWEAGYFAERPTPGEFLDALREDVDAKQGGTGRAVYAAEDADAATERELDREWAKRYGDPTLSFLGTQEAYERAVKTLRDLKMKAVLDIKNDDLTQATRLLSAPWWIAKNHPEAKTVIFREIAREEERAHLTHTFLKSPVAKREGWTHEFLSLTNKKAEGLFKVMIESDEKNKVFTVAELEGRGMDEEQAVAYYAWKRSMDNARGELFKTADELTLKPYENESWHGLLKDVYEGKKTDIEATGELKGPEMDAFMEAVGKVMPVHKTIQQYRKEMGRIKFYVPRTRVQGKYVIRVKDGENVLWSEHATDKIRGKRVEVRLKKKFPGKKIEVSIENRPSEYIYQDISDASVEKFIERAIDKAKARGRIEAADAVGLRDALLEAVAEDLKGRGFGSHMIRRSEGLPIGGYKTTGGKRIFIEYMTGLSGFVSKQKAAYDFYRELEGINIKKKPVLYEEMSQYVKDMLRNTTSLDRVSGKFRSVAFTWYLAGNLKSAAVQFSQNYVTGIPYLSRETKGAVVKYQKAMADIATGRITEEERAALAEAFDKGATTAQYLKEVTGKVKGRLGGTYEKAVDILSAPFSGMEVLNRKFAFLAMWRIATKEQGLKGEAAYEKARDFVYDTHFLMGKANLPGWARGGTPAHALARTSYTFRSFTHNYLLSMVNSMKNVPEGKSRLGVVGRSLAFVALTGGLLSLPFLDDILDELERLTGTPYRKQMRERLRGWGGDLLSRVGMEGLPALVGVDISGSLKTGVPFTGGEGAAETVYGVYGGLMDKGVQAAQSVIRGDYLRAVEKAAPVFAENMMKAGRMYSEGMTNQSGKVLTDEYGEPVKLTGREAVTQGLSFRPQRLAEASKDRRTFANITKAYTDRKDRIVDRFRLARTEKEQERVYDEIDKFNEDVIEAGGAVSPITADTLRSALRPSINKRYMNFQEELR